MLKYLCKWQVYRVCFPNFESEKQREEDEYGGRDGSRKQLSMAQPARFTYFNIHLWTFLWVNFSSEESGSEQSIRRPTTKKEKEKRRRRIELYVLRNKLGFFPAVSCPHWLCLLFLFFFKHKFYGPSLLLPDWAKPRTRAELLLLRYLGEEKKKESLDHRPKRSMERKYDVGFPSGCVLMTTGQKTREAESIWVAQKRMKTGTKQPRRPGELSASLRHSVLSPRSCVCWKSFCKVVVVKRKVGEKGDVEWKKRSGNWKRV